MAFSGEVIGNISETFDKGEFEWRINVCPNKILGKKHGEYLCSPTFSFSSCSWLIQMYPNVVVSNKEWVSLFLIKKKSQSEKYVSFSFVMTLQSIKLPVNNGSVNFLYKNDRGYTGFLEYILRKEFLDHLSKETKRCSQLTIKIRLRDLFQQNEDALHIVKRKGKENLCQNYKDLLLHGRDHDLVIKVKDQEFKAHRTIMQCRCPVFKSMLENEMLEKNTGVVEIPDCDPVAFEQFLFHVYTGEPDVLDENTMLGLYFIADKYNMEDLKEECSIFIKKSLSVNVVPDVIKLALNHSDTALLEYATKYFIDNAINILVTVEWQSFIKENPIQANELIIKVVDKCCYCCVCSMEDNATNSSKEESDHVAVSADK